MVLQSVWYVLLCEKQTDPDDLMMFLIPARKFFTEEVKDLAKVKGQGQLSWVARLTQIFYLNESMNFVVNLLQSAAFTEQQ